jgi:hypothetical protein
MQRSPKLAADTVGGLVWLAFGVAVVYGSWTMDRLESLGINPVTAPGLLPGLLGLGLVAFGLILILRQQQSDAHPGDGSGAGGYDWRRLTLSWLFCVTFAGVFLGRGAPFWLLAAVFVFLHIFFLEDADRVASTSASWRAAVAAVIALAAAVLVTFLFQSVFLIRLP